MRMSLEETSTNQPNFQFCGHNTFNCHIYNSQIHEAPI